MISNSSIEEKGCLINRLNVVKFMEVKIDDNLFQQSQNIVLLIFIALTIILIFLLCELQKQFRVILLPYLF